MNLRRQPPGLLATLLPWPVFFAVQALGWRAGAAGAGLLTLAGMHLLLRRRPRTPDVLFGLFFILLLACDLAGAAPWIHAWRSAAAAFMLAAMALVSLVLGRPFTLEFAREESNRLWWNHPEFLRVNRILTWMWAGVFLASGLFALARTAHPEWGAARAVLPPLALTGAAFLVTFRFPKWYQRHVYVPRADDPPLPEPRT
jgi:hypothetical protein